VALMAAWECGLCYLGWNSFEEWREHTKRRHPENWTAYVTNLGAEPKNGEHAIELELEHDQERERDDNTVILYENEDGICSHPLNDHINANYKTSDCGDVIGADIDGVRVSAQEAIDLIQATYPTKE
jgi:hypothetical protein